MSISSLDFTREHSPDFIKQAIPRIRAETDIATDELEGAAKLWIGKDYTNFIVKDFTHLNMPFQDSIDRSTTPRMPWHDLSCVIVGTTARDVARHFIQRWNYTKFSKAKFNDRYPWLVPKSYQDMDHVEIPHYLTRTHRVRCQVVGLAIFHQIIYFSQSDFSFPRRGQLALGRLESRKPRHRL